MKISRLSIIYQDIKTKDEFAENMLVKHEDDETDEYLTELAGKIPGEEFKVLSVEVEHLMTAPDTQLIFTAKGWKNNNRNIQTPQEDDESDN